MYQNLNYNPWNCKQKCYLGLSEKIMVKIVKFLTLLTLRNIHGFLSFNPNIDFDILVESG